MITEIIIALTVILSLYTLYGNRELYEALTLRPYRDYREGNYYTLATCGFIHVDLMHLLFNMLSLYFFGHYVDRELGSVGFTCLYLASILGGAGVSYWKNKDNPYYATVGASGGVSGIIFASILFYPYSHVGFLFLPVAIPGPLFAVLYLIYSYYSAQDPGERINHDGHFYGALTGVAVAIFAKPESLSMFIIYLQSIFL